MQHIFINQNEIITPEFFTVYHQEDGNKYNRIEAALNQYMFTEHINVIKIELYKNGTKTTQPKLEDVIYKDVVSNQITVSYSFDSIS